MCYFLNQLLFDRISTPSFYAARRAGVDINILFLPCAQAKNSIMSTSTWLKSCARRHEVSCEVNDWLTLEECSNGMQVHCVIAISESEWLRASLVFGPAQRTEDVNANCRSVKMSVRHGGGSRKQVWFKKFETYRTVHDPVECRCGINAKLGLRKVEPLVSSPTNKHLRKVVTGGPASPSYLSIHRSVNRVISSVWINSGIISRFTF